MIDAANVAEVGSDEVLARYIVHSSHIRRSDSTLKPDAFIPHPYPDLSVTRHLSATDGELWSIGNAIAEGIGKTLYGRGDIRASTCLAQQLEVKARPSANNTNHADVTGWPADKPGQKIIAQEIAATAAFVPKK